MPKYYLWEALKWPGLENLQLRTETGAIQVDSLVIARLAGDPIRFAYRLTCDIQWRFLHARLELLDEDRRLELSSDGQGRWFDAD
jgi:hypothetical protein